MTHIPAGAVKPSSIEVDAYEPLLSAQRLVDIPTNMQMRAIYTSTDGQPAFVGHAPRGLETTVTGWLLWKLTYDANRQCTLRQIAYDSWANATTASYA